MSNISERGYANPDTLVSTYWVSEHLNDKNVRIIESNEDLLLYPSGHILGAVQIDWEKDLNDQLRRDYLNKQQFEKLMSKVGITLETTVIFYGDKNNWWACYAYWIFKLFKHENTKIMDGGRLKWEKEKREMTKEIPRYPETKYEAPERDDSEIRAFRDQILKQIKNGFSLVDVRSPQEYSGERLHMPDYPNEGALRGGHIPGAKNIPWAKAINPVDGTFKSAEELRNIYEKENGLSSKNEVIAYCRIGERSSHTWFVLTNLLGYSKVRNYDGSWTEWGNLVGVPIEK
jgi:thiosulfate/3-mercaptopyruvate sulfurtransferase